MRRLNYANRTRLGACMSSFVPLTLALKGLFDKPLGELPEALSPRVEREFCLIAWDVLSAEQREIVALQCDYPDDPETEQERRSGWEWAGRKEAIMAQVTEWEATATPTALDLAQKGTRLSELRHELDQIKAEACVDDIEPDTANQTKPKLDLTVLATPAQLLSAFGQWGLKTGWFNEPTKHPWLLAARKQPGRGGNTSAAPLYCPYEVMIGLTTKIRLRHGGVRPSREKGFQLLKRFFPAVYAKFEIMAPDDDQS